MIWSFIKIGSIHFQRFQNVFIDVDLVFIAAEPLDNLPQENKAKIGIAVTTAGFEFDFGVGEHRDDLRPGCRLEWMPWFIATPRPGRRSKTAAVREQMSDRYCLNRSELIVDRAELWNVFHDRVIKF